MSENESVQTITRKFLNEFVPQNIPDEVELVDTVCDEYFKAAAQPSKTGKKKTAGMKFIDPTVAAAFITPVLAAILSSIAKTVVESAIAKRTKLANEKEILKALEKHKEISPELGKKLASAFAKFLQDNPALLKENA
jgi:hypothetical protein